MILSLVVLLDVLRPGLFLNWRRRSVGRRGSSGRALGTMNVDTCVIVIVIAHCLDSSSPGCLAWLVDRGIFIG